MAKCPVCLVVMDDIDILLSESGEMHFDCEIGVFAEVE